MSGLDGRAFCRAMAAGARVSAAARLPNIVYVLADDLGWGDLDCYANRLAAEGVRFTDMHSPSAVCTPTRYGILTGRYCWRSRLKKGVLWGYDPNLIEEGRLTVPAMLQSRGYYTAGFGKWHLGLGNREKTDYTQPLRPGPLDHGFDAAAHRAYRRQQEPAGRVLEAGARIGGEAHLTGRRTVPKQS